MFRSKALGRLAVLSLLFLSAGSQAAEEYIALDDSTTIKVFLFLPKAAGDGPWPLAVLMPGGQGQEYTARSQFWLGKELTERGWTIAVPIAPDSGDFFEENAKLIPRVIAKLHDNPSIRPGKSLLLGVSTGGSSALEIAGLNPEDYLGVIAVPGRLRKDSALPDMHGLPVFLRIAEKDAFRWQKRMPGMVQRLEGAGARVNAALVPDARHTFRINWDELDPWLDALEGGQIPPSPAH